MFQSTIGSFVVVISPLLNLIKDQVNHLNSLGISAISISDIEDESVKQDIEQGKFSLVYGTPEAWLTNERWRSMLQNKVYTKNLHAIAIDEAHIIKQCGTSLNKKLAPFREAYSRLNQLRSLAPNSVIIALTATATKSTRKTIFNILRLKNHHIIFQSPNKENITYSVEYMPKDFEIETYFWMIVIQELKEKETTAAEL